VSERVPLGPPRSKRALKGTLDRFLRSTDFSPLVARDPLALVRRYEDPHDQEVAGLLVAALAYGRAEVIQQKAALALEKLGPSPARAVEAGEGEELDGFVYRFQRGRDLPRFLAAIAAIRAAHGSLAAAFAEGIDPSEADYSGAMDRFVLALRAQISGPLSHGLAFLLPRGAAKRVCLFLRWMVREGEVDLGAWPRLRPGAFDPAKLIIPLDTHIERIGRYIGLTDRRTGGLETAKEITAQLAKLRPEDPLAYDLALCHLGISGRCPRKRDLVRCEGCPIRSICRLGEEPRGWI
jgi:uncharacterized protein (TIGR02757 family)